MPEEQLNNPKAVIRELHGVKAVRLAMEDIVHPECRTDAEMSQTVQQFDGDVPGDCPRCGHPLNEVPPSDAT